MLKVLISMCAQGQRKKKPMRLATIDIKRAYFHAAVQREVYVEIPVEDRMPGDEGMVGRLKVSLYDQRCGPELGQDIH